MQEELSILIQAQYPLIYLVTSEEERAEQAIALIAERKPEKKLFVWTLTRGILEHGGTGSPQHNTMPPQQALEFAIRQSDAAIFVFKDLHPFLGDGGSAEVVRYVRDAIAAFKGTQKTIIRFRSNWKRKWLS